MLTRTRASAVAAAADSPVDPLDECSRRVDEIVQRFRSEPVTPQRFLELERSLRAAADEMCRQTLEREANHPEPDDKRALPPQVRYRKEMYRINKKTPACIATRFGPITLRSFYYLNNDDGEPGLHPLWLRLGIGPGFIVQAYMLAAMWGRGELLPWMSS